VKSHEEAFAEAVRQGREYVATGITPVELGGVAGLVDRLTNRLELAASMPVKKKSMIRIFVEQYRRCRRRELSRPLGVLHALRHAWRTAWTR